MCKVDRTAFVRRLRAVREELGLDPPEMADRVGAPRTTYYNWEAETPKKPNFPSKEMMVQIRDALDGLTLDYLYTGRLSTMRTALAIRLTAREMGMDPDDRGFQPEAVVSAVVKAG